MQYNENGTGLTENSNTIIREIADDMIKPPEMISIGIRATMNVMVRKGKGGNPTLAVAFAAMNADGDTHYRSFPLEEVLKPDRVTFICRIEKKVNPESGILIEATNLPWFGFDNRFLVRQLPHFSADSDTVVIENFQLFFSDAAMNPYHERVSLINDYYAASALFDTLQLGIRQIDFVLSGNYPRYFIFIEEMNKILSIIKDKDIAAKLNLITYDPRGFLKKQDKIFHAAEETTNTFRDRIKATTLIVPFDSTNILIREFLAGMLRYVRWSMLVSERNSRMYYQYLHDYYTMNAFGKDGIMIRDLVARVYPKENPTVVMTRISQEIKTAYNKMADDLIRDHQFAESVELLKNARSFSKINSYLKETDGDKKITTSAANGIYDSFLGVAEGALENGKYQMAQLYLQKAQLYRKDHTPFVTSDSLYKKVTKELYADRSAQCDSLFVHGRYPEAFDCYREFKGRYDSVTLTLTHPEIEKRIAYCMKRLPADPPAPNLKATDKTGTEKLHDRSDFHQDIGAPVMKRSKKRHKSEPGQIEPKATVAAAVKLPEPDPVITDPKQVNADPLTDSLIENPYPHFLANLLSTNAGRIWTNQLPIANQLVDSVAYVQRTHGMGSSRELSDAIATYRRKINVRKCWNEKDNVEIFLLRAGRDREKKDYFHASLLSDSALFCIKKNPDCDLSAAGIEDTLKVYAEAVEYQKKIRDLQRLMVPHKEKDLVKALWTAEQYYTAHHINRFGLTNLSTYESVREKSDQGLTFQAFLFFKQNQHIQESLEYLRLLRLQDYPVDKAKDYLESLGKRFAEKDFKEHPAENPTEKVVDYTHGDKWFKRFADSYKRDWKSHRKLMKH